MKYSLTNNKETLYENGKFIYLYQIKAEESVGNVMEGELGGYIESEKNLSKTSGAWVCPTSYVYGDACVKGQSIILGHCHIRGNAQIIDSLVDATKVNNGTVQDSKIFDSTINNGIIRGGYLERCEISDSAFILDATLFDCKVRKNAMVKDRLVRNAELGLNATVNTNKPCITICGGSECLMETFYHVADVGICGLAHGKEFIVPLDDYEDGKLKEFVREQLK